MERCASASSSIGTTPIENFGLLAANSLSLPHSSGMLPV
jgi:hypothetical protein